MPTLPMPTACPVTGEPLTVTRLECEASGVAIEGRFAPNEFALLPEDQLEFLRIFVKVRGNLKEAERVLGLSYPTVRLRFDALLRTLGYEATAEVGEERAGILDRLEKGEISAEEAAKQLQSLRRRSG
jgi:hypothetical protein